VGTFVVPIDDPIERLGRRYGRLSDGYLLSRPDFPFEMKPRPSGPTAFEVFAWYHQLTPERSIARSSARHARLGVIKAATMTP